MAYFMKLYESVIYDKPKQISLSEFKVLYNLKFYFMINKYEFYERGFISENGYRY